MRSSSPQRGRRLSSSAIMAVVALATCFAAVGLAHATGSKASYVPTNPRLPCRTHYRKHVDRVVKHARITRRVVCLLVKPHPSGSTGPTGATAAKGTLLGQPTFTQSASNPLDVTFNYAAQVNPASGLADLPSGTLEFFSDGTLRCSTSVPAGLRIGAGTCEVILTAYGDHSVEAVYRDGSHTTTSVPTNVTIERPAAQPTPPVASPEKIPTRSP